MKKTLLITLGCLCFAIQTFADKVVYINGKKAEKSLAQISFAGDNAILRYDDASTFSLDMELIEIEFSCPTRSEITGASIFSVNTTVNDQLNIKGADLNDALMIISANGKIMYSGIAHSNKVSIPASHLPVGSYLLKVGSRTIKFIKK